MRKLFSKLLALSALALAHDSFAAGKAEHIVVVVWDGMRPDFISQEHTPTLFQLARDGVMFANHHPVYCSATEVNGTAIATGCYPEHSGIIANRDYLPEVEPLKVVDLQSHEIVRKGDKLTGGNYLLRPTLAELLHADAKTTAIAGAKEVALLHDRRERKGRDLTNVALFQGQTLPASALAAIKKLEGAFPGDVPLVSESANSPRDEWTRRALTETLWSKGVPAYSLLWLSEPDFSQHAAGPGSPKALAALESSDRQLAAVLAELQRRGLRGKTDLFVVSDHGFSTVAKEFDVCAVLRGGGFSAFRDFKSAPKAGDILVVGEGGSVLFYVIGHDRSTVEKLVTFLQRQEFAGVVFSRERLPGTFSLEDAKINSPRAPDVVLSMRWSADNSQTGAPGMLWSDGGRKPGQGTHASLSRSDMHNTLVGAGPDLKTGFSDAMPSGNTDLAPTMLWLLGVETKTPMDGRILSEALSVDAPESGRSETRRIETHCEIGSSVWRQYLQISRVKDTVYFDEGNGELSPK